MMTKFHWSITVITICRDLTVKSKNLYLVLSHGLYLEAGLYQRYLSSVYQGLYHELYQGYTIFCYRVIFAPIAIFVTRLGQIGLMSSWLLPYIMEYLNVICSIKHCSSWVKHALKKSINGSNCVVSTATFCIGKRFTYFAEELVTFTEEILNEKLHCSVITNNDTNYFYKSSVNQYLFQRTQMDEVHLGAAAWFQIANHWSGNPVLSLLLHKKLF